MTPYPATRVLIVDDDVDVRYLACAVVAASGDMEVAGEAADGFEAIDRVRDLRPDIVLMDVEMPRMDGPTATEMIRREHGSRVRIVAFTGRVESQSVVRMIVAGATGYAVKGGAPEKIVDALRDAMRAAIHVDPEAVPGLLQGVVKLAREEQERRMEAERLQAELETSYRETIGALAAALDARDEATQDHVDRVTDRAVAVGEKLGLCGDELRQVEHGALFHDVGKIGIPDSILKSANPLTPAERREIEMHTIYGQRIVERVAFLRPVSIIVRASHEHWDGSGYPDKLRGEDIPVASRIVLACDAFDAMTAGRKYRAGLTCTLAAANLRKDAGSQFDPVVVRALLEVLVEEGTLTDTEAHPGATPVAATQEPQRAPGSQPV